MPRKRGALEERLREAVIARIRKRGDAAALARAINKPQSFVTEYLERKQHASLDTTVAIAKYFHFSLRTLTGLDPYPEFDEGIEALVAAYRSAETDELRRAALLILRAPGSVDLSSEERRSPALPSPASLATVRKNR